MGPGLPRRRLQEQELAFFAQDDQGNVWNFGEYPEEYDNGKFTGAPSTWIRNEGGAYGGPSTSHGHSHGHGHSHDHGHEHAHG